MIKYDFNSISKLIPKVCDWIESHENYILDNGRELKQNEITTAQKIGIKNYHLIRVIETDQVPIPTDAVIRLIGHQIGLISPDTSGICFRYGIFIHKNANDKKEVLLHELIHTLQYERFGSIKSFIVQYLNECIEMGYEFSPLELEAITSSKFFLS